ncbi:hypothetical protein FRC17_004156 [Serendipita sp. 399]|nr:hypothetical protein FRC17_004156 [Serendipita sp. 399]
MFAAFSTAQDEFSPYCINTLSNKLSLSVIPVEPTAARLPPLRLISDGTGDISTMVVCSDCGLPSLIWGLNGGVLQASNGRPTTGGGTYNLFVEPNEQPDFITTRLLPPPRYPIYCAIPDSVGSKTGYLALHGTPKEFYTCANLIPTFAPTDRRDVYWRVDTRNATYPRGECKRAAIRYQLL